jgi:hypothetical protein
MKFYLYTLVILLAIELNANATVYTVSNDPTIPAQYSSFADAQTTSSAGDTIYLYGTFSGYNGFQIDKKLTIIGAGYNPNTQFHYKTMVLGSLIANHDSIRIEGLQANSGINVIGNHTLISRCKVEYYYSAGGCAIVCSGSSDLTVENSILLGGIYNANNSKIFNNIFYSAYIYNGTSTSISNNVFFNTSIYNYGIYNTANCLIRNNIFYNCYVLQASYCQFLNNLTYTGYLETIPYGTNSGNNNIINKDPQFVNFSGPTTFSFDSDFHLKSTSPAKNAGVDSADIGIFGGSTLGCPPWPQFSNGQTDYSGEPPIPVVRTFNVQNAYVGSDGILRFNSTGTNKK